MRMISLIAFFFLTQASRAEHYQFTYGDSGMWVTDTLTLDTDGWPKLERRESSSERFAVQAARPARAKDIPGSGTELRGASAGEIWTATETWTWDWELRYTEWVKAEIDRGWWKRHGIATDCADVVLSARWVFARMHGLPAANHLITGHILTNRSLKTEWEQLPTAPEWYNDQRFLAALDYLLSQAFTHSLLEDSYPIEINAQALLPGGYHLKLFDDTGHTQFIQQVGTRPDEVPIVTLNSTTPRDLRDAFEYVFFDNEARAPDYGFMRMRWPVWVDGAVTLIAPADMPYYSLEQFDPNFIQRPRWQFWDEVFHRINPNANLTLLSERTLTLVHDLFLQRIPIVEQGWQVCSVTPCVEGSLEWEAWSTPNRDQRIMNAIGVFSALVDRVGTSSKNRRLLHTRTLTYERDEYNLYDLIKIWEAGQFTSDPNDEIRVRWGL